MRQHFVLVVVVIIITVSLFTAWFVRVLDALLIQQSSSRVLEFTGQVESSPTLNDWSEVSIDQAILPNTYLRAAEESTLTIWIDPISRLVLQPNTQVHYLGFQRGKPTWEVITGTVNGRYDHPSNPDRALALQLNQSTVTITQATFQVRNELTDTSVTAYDQPLQIELAATAETDQTTLTVQPGETYALSESNSTIATNSQVESVPTEPAPATATSSSQTATTDQSNPIQSQTTILPDSLQDFGLPSLTSSISLTISTTKPLTLIWTESNAPTESQKYRIFRSETTPLDEKTAEGYRTATGKQQVSYVWPLPSKTKTYHFRVCRLTNNQCEVWSNTITIPAGTVP